MANQKRYESVQRTIDIVFREVPLTVEFTFYPALPATEFEPPESEMLEIDEVLVDDINVVNLMGVNTLEELVEAVYKEVNKLKEDV